MKATLKNNITATVNGEYCIIDAGTPVTAKMIGSKAYNELKKDGLLNFEDDTPVQEEPEVVPLDPATLDPADLVNREVLEIEDVAPLMTKDQLEAAIEGEKNRKKTRVTAMRAYESALEDINEAETKSLIDGDGGDTETEGDD